MILLSIDGCFPVSKSSRHYQITNLTMVSNFWLRKDCSLTMSIAIFELVMTSRLWWIVAEAVQFPERRWTHLVKYRSSLSLLSDTMTEIVFSHPNRLIIALGWFKMPCSSKEDSAMKEEYLGFLVFTVWFSCSCSSWLHRRGHNFCFQKSRMPLGRIGIYFFFCNSLLVSSTPLIPTRAHQAMALQVTTEQVVQVGRATTKWLSAQIKIK